MPQVSQLPPTVDAPTLADLVARQAPITVLDVRSPAEYASEHIPGSVNVPLEELPEHAGRLGASLQGPVVLVCRSGVRAQQAEQALRRADLSNLHVLDGGIAAWEEKRQPLIRGKRRWAMDRQVRGVAGVLVLAGALAGLLLDRKFTWLAAAVGAGLTFSAITNTCAMAKGLSLLPYNRTGQSCDIAAVLAALERRQHRAAAA